LERIELQLYSLLPLVVIVASTMAKYRKFSPSTKAFLFLCGTVFLMLILDILGFAWAGIPGRFSRSMNYAGNLLYFIFLPFMMPPWLCYIDLLLFDDIDRLKRRIFYLPPAMVSALMVVTTIGRPFVFYLDASNMYQRGPGSHIMTALLWAFVMYGGFLFLRNRKRLESGAQGVVALFIAFPFLGNAFQIVFPGTSLALPSSVLTLLVTYIFLEIKTEPKDYLTGLMIRSQMDEHLRFRIENGLKMGDFALVLIDMDGLGEINAAYGHQTGDQVLCSFAKILQKEITEDEKASRFGGDEFILCLDSGDLAAIETRMGKIRESLEQMNKGADYPFAVNFSWGHEMYLAADPQGLESLYARADRRLYLRKTGSRKKEKARG